MNNDIKVETESQEVVSRVVRGNTLETVISAVGTPVRTNAVWPSATYRQGQVPFTSNRDGTITYTGRPDITVIATADATLNHVGGGTDDLSLYIALNGTVLVETQITQAISGSRNISTNCRITLSTGDTLEQHVANESDTSNIVVEDSMFTLSVCSAGVPSHTCSNCQNHSVTWSLDLNFLVCAQCGRACEKQPPASVFEDEPDENFATGARRDSQGDKPRYDLIPLGALKRLAELYASGAKHYGENNWQKGMPMRRTYASMFRHMVQWAVGDKSEDHLRAVAWNAFALMFYEDEIAAGRLPEELNDMNWPKNV